ncbi:hypothetical protein LIER_28729 [Lithospermum erythrorhizon]|uniref:Reverse transcriptase domain-containing protein n=1 Tax=Lithospermum erythrorhizon TaxID=34254 RepID=A0AAV3RIA8_LITER
MGLNPSTGAMENYAKLNWNRLGFEEMFRLTSGMFLFRFKTDEDRYSVLAEGPWMFAKRPIILKAWTLESNLERKGADKIPVWIRIPNLSLQFWNEEIFSKITMLMVLYRMWLKLPMLDCVLRLMQRMNSRKKSHWGKKKPGKQQAVWARKQNEGVMVVEEKSNDDLLNQDAIVDTIVIQEKSCEAKKIAVSNPFEVLDEADEGKTSSRSEVKRDSATGLDCKSVIKPRQGSQTMKRNLVSSGAARKAINFGHSRSTKTQDDCHGGYSFYLTAIYGRNNKLERTSLWSNLCSDKVVVQQCPWIVIGDFNVIRSVEEAKGGKVTDRAAISEFNDCLSTVGLMDFPHEGCRFTWNRNWEEKSILRVLDRVVCNNAWLQRMIECTAFNDRIEGDAMEVLNKKIKILKGRLKELNVREYHLFNRDPEKIKMVIVDFYKDFFINKGTHDMQLPLNASLQTVSDQNKGLLCANITKEEIEGVVKSMKKAKALGPDDFPIEFVKDTWEITKESVVEANPKNMKQFRPIACCTSIYKIISTIIANILKNVLDQVVAIQQTVYVPGRRITDGILVMQELMNGYHKNSGSARCVIKIDIPKAYDIVKWSFLWDVMSRMEFPAVFVNWIKMCLTSAWFSISLNGSLNDFFSSTRGLRQGDPLSPYLFIIMMEAFNSLLRMNMERYGYDFHLFCENIRLIHVCFADDVFLVAGAIRFLKIREHAKTHIKVRVGNGRGCNFLFDNWHEAGPIHLAFTAQEISHMRVSITDSVGDVLERGRLVCGRRVTFGIQQVFNKR